MIREPKLETEKVVQYSSMSCCVSVTGRLFTALQTTEVWFSLLKIPGGKIGHRAARVDFFSVNLDPP